MSSLPYSDRQIQRFWGLVGKTDNPDDCWIWQGSKDTAGYGSLSFGPKIWRASRLAFYLANGYLELDKFVCHKCDNPPCCNPNHLFLGTNKDNVADMIRKGRKYVSRGEAAPSAKLTEADVRKIRDSALSRLELSRLYGVTPENIYAIQIHKSWKHVRQT